MAPILRERGLTGLVEPLGFPISSMRTKAEAIAAIEAAGGADVYKLMHDTFHHHLAGETELFPEWTGLVHISGVTDPDVAVDDMLDAHRVLVDGKDRLENIPQLKSPSWPLVTTVQSPLSPLPKRFTRLTIPKRRCARA